VARHRRRDTRAAPPLLLACGLTLGVAVACGGGSSAPSSAARTPPDLQGFLREPVATPTACPSGASGSASGRRSPWVGHVDVSVFVDPAARPSQVRRLGDDLRHQAHVRTVYMESTAQAYGEYQRLYTCWAGVPRSAVPASYRLVLDPLAQADRDALVREIVRLPGVKDVACDPSDPCTQAATAG
jgi:hypothetical protein